MEKVESNLLTFQTSDFVGIFVSVQLYVLVVGPALPRVPFFVRLSVYILSRTFINKSTIVPAVGGTCVCACNIISSWFLVPAGK